MESAPKRTCKAQTRAGQPCRARAVTTEGLCAAHGGLVDMKAIGQAGGKASVRSRLGLDVDANDSLRAKARKRLDAMLDDADPRVALRAAQSLFSSSSAKPPSEPSVDGWNGSYAKHRPITIASILNVAVFECEGIVDVELADMILRCAAEVRRLEAEGLVLPTLRPAWARAHESRRRVWSERLLERVGLLGKCVSFPGSSGHPSLA